MVISFDNIRRASKNYLSLQNVLFEVLVPFERMIQYSLAV